MHIARMACMLLSGRAPRMGAGPGAPLISTQNFSAALMTLIAFAGCGPTNPASSAPSATLRQEIRGGTYDNSDPAVVAIAVSDQGYYDQFCSGTLIGGKTVLTA